MLNRFLSRCLSGAAGALAGTPDSKARRGIVRVH